MDTPQVAIGTPVQFKSRIGYTYDGTVMAGPDDAGRYTVVTGDHATATVSYEDLILPERAAPDPTLTPEQLAAARDERITQTAERLATEAMQTLYSTAREWAREEGALDESALDALRIQVVTVFADKAIALKDAMTAQVAEKATRPAPESARDASNADA